MREREILATPSPGALVEWFEDGQGSFELMWARAQNAYYWAAVVCCEEGSGGNPLSALENAWWGGIPNLTQPLKDQPERWTDNSAMLFLLVIQSIDSIELWWETEQGERDHWRACAPHLKMVEAESLIELHKLLAEAAKLIKHKEV